MYRNFNLGGLILILVGLLLLLDNLIPGFEFGDWWPLILILIGVSIFMRRRNHYHCGPDCHCSCHDSSQPEGASK